MPQLNLCWIVEKNLRLENIRRTCTQRVYNKCKKKFNLNCSSIGFNGVTVGFSRMVEACSVDNALIVYFAGGYTAWN